MQAPGVQRQRCVRELDLTISNSPVSAPVSGTLFSSAPLPSRAASASRVLQLPFFVQPPRGVAERREAPALKQVALVGRDTTLARHGPSRATGTPPRGAPPWRCRPRVRSRLRHCRIRCEGSTPPGETCPAAAPGVSYPRLRAAVDATPAPSSGSSPETPLVEQDSGTLHRMRYVVNRYLRGEGKIIACRRQRSRPAATPLRQHARQRAAELVMTGCCSCTGWPGLPSSSGTMAR